MSSCTAIHKVTNRVRRWHMDQAHCSVKRGSLRRQMMLNLAWCIEIPLMRSVWTWFHPLAPHRTATWAGDTQCSIQYSSGPAKEASEDQGETLRSMLSQIKEGFRWALMVRFTEADFGLVVHLLGSYLVTAHAVARFAFRCDSSVG